MHKITAEIFFTKMLTQPQLFGCYDVLSKMDKYDISEENLQDLISLLQTIVVRTEAFASTCDDKETALKMKENFDKFQGKLESNKVLFDNPEIQSLLSKLVNLWKIVKRIFDNNLKSEKESKNISQAIDWFKKNSVELFNDNDISVISKDSITETLMNALVNFKLIDKLTKFIYRTMEIINSYYVDDYYLKWKRKLYIYDNKKKCSVAFFIEDKAFGTYFVDEYGNIYLNEIQFLQTLRKFNGYYDFTDLSGTLYNVKLIYDEDFLDMLLKTFQRVNQGNVFSKFISGFEDKEEEIINILKNLKIFFLFLLDMNIWFTKNVTLSFDHKERLKISADLGHYFLHFETLITKYDRFEQNMNLLTSTGFEYDRFVENMNSLTSKEVQYDDFEQNMNLLTSKGFQCHMNFLHIVVQIMYQFNGKFDNFDSSLIEIYEKQITDSARALRWNLGDITRTPHGFLYYNVDVFLSVCHYIAAKIFEYLKTENLLRKKLHLIHIKYAFLWVAEKYKGIKDNKTIINEYELHKETVNNEFHSLLESVMECEKSTLHQFPNNFVAAYNFSKHYNFIRRLGKRVLKQFVKLAGEILIKNDHFTKHYQGASKLPIFEKNNVKECASFYLKYLPDFVFDEKFCKGTYSVPEAEKWQNFERCSIKGLKCQINGISFISTLFAAPKMLDLGINIELIAHGSDTDKQYMLSSRTFKLEFI